MLGMGEKDSRPGLDSLQRHTLLVRRCGERPGPAANGRESVAPVPALHTTRREGEGASTPRESVQSALSRLEDDLAGRHPALIERVLVTVLFTDIVDSTARAAAVGDAAWKRMLDRHDRIAHSAVAECGGRLVKGTGDGVLATFDAPVCGLRCAKALRMVLSHAGIAIRAGVHTGEVELRGDDVAGIGVHIAARVAALAGSGELLASRTVKDLAAGSGYTFTSRGVHALKGVPEKWELLAVT